MLVYKKEVEDGLKDVIASNLTVACYGIIKPIEVKEFTEETVARCLDITKASQETVDLFPMAGILVSTGANLNDDYFHPLEVWNARKTPEDKPFNYEHMGTDIIGHITGTYATKKDGTIIPDDTLPEDLPQEFNITNSSVLYKHWRDPDHARRANKIIEEIKAGEWFLSMEALFTGFDYGMLNESTGQFKIVERNDSTAGMSKFLRSYGGKGVYQNCKILRVMRNIVFAGKGLVKRPANKDSVIFNSETSLASVEKPMSDELNKKVEELNKELETLKASVIEKDKQVTTLTAKVDELNKAVAESKTVVENLTKEKSEIQASFDKLNKEKLSFERTVAFKNAGASDEDSKKYAEQFINLNDEQFKTVLAAMSFKTEAKTEVKNSEQKVNEVLDTAKAEETASLSVDNTNSKDNREEVIANLGGFLKANFFNTVKGKK